MAPCNPNPCRGAGMAAIVPASILCAVPFPSSRFDSLCPFVHLGIRNKAVGKLRASIDAEAEADERGPPLIDLQFLGPDAEPDVGNEKIVVVSGDKLLRNIMIDNKLELYDLYGKVMNCGGGGSCGTCLVEIVDGQDLLNERTDTENRYLKKKPNSWRLACQTIVGNKINSGKVTVQRLPQKKRK